ncbi:hypothetical protein HK102_005157 [Quaeritorhiza haematococci]|nr:hypothetical protein HK102_005157 [Quaeritorhiza haematococci]
MSSLTSLRQRFTSITSPPTSTIPAIPTIPPNLNAMDSVTSYLTANQTNPKFIRSSINAMDPLTSPTRWPLFTTVLFLSLKTCYCDDENLASGMYPLTAGGLALDLYIIGTVLISAVLFSFVTRVVPPRSVGSGKVPDSISLDMVLRMRRTVVSDWTIFAFVVGIICSIERERCRGGEKEDDPVVHTFGIGRFMVTYAHYIVFSVAEWLKFDLVRFTVAMMILTSRLQNGW